MRTNFALTVILVVGLTNLLNGQVDLYHLIRMNEKHRIALKTLVGTWMTTDTIKSQIEFFEEGVDVCLKPKVHQNYYRFRREKDSVCVYGVAVSWPPYYCFLNLIEPKKLEIRYYNSHENKLDTIIFSKK